jgi:Tfp pilus assembly protein PilO
MAFIRVYKTYLTGTAIVWAASLALCLLAYVFVLRPQYNNKRQLDSTFAEQQQLYAAARRAAQEETKIRLNEQIERLRDRIKSFVVDLEESTDLTFDISQIANRENLDELSVTMRAERSTRGSSVGAGAQSKPSYIDEHYIDIKFSAGFLQFATFVNALERHRPILFIDEFKIALSRKNDPVYQVTIDVAAFVNKQKHNETAAETFTKTDRANL